MCRLLTTSDSKHGLELCQQFSSRVEIVNIDATEAQGPLQARSIQSRMVPPPRESVEEESRSFCMQVDSHMVRQSHG